jgi:hypothetical protein
VIAAELLAARADLQPPDTWRLVAELVFPLSASSREKGCPRDAFLGLCDVGAIEGVEPGSYTKSVLNKDYAVRALDALRADASLSSDERKLWRIAVNGADRQQNSQMDVLISLWRRGHIVVSPRTASDTVLIAPTPPAVPA